MDPERANEYIREQLASNPGLVRKRMMRRAAIEDAVAEKGDLLTPQEEAEIDRQIQQDEAGQLVNNVMSIKSPEIIDSEYGLSFIPKSGNEIRNELAYQQMAGSKFKRALGGSGRYRDWLYSQTEPAIVSGRQPPNTYQASGLEDAVVDGINKAQRHLQRTGPVFSAAAPLIGLQVTDYDEAPRMLKEGVESITGSPMAGEAAEVISNLIPGVSALAAVDQGRIPGVLDFVGGLNPLKWSRAEKVLTALGGAGDLLSRWLQQIPKSNK